MTKVTFGTSGHRGIIGDSFTNKHVQAVAYSVATFLKTTNSTPTCVIGFDPRTGNDPELKDRSFTKMCIDTLNKYGINTVSFTECVPTPFISWAITHFNYDGGLILTASHNPKEYNGIKFNPKNGAPAPQEITKQIEITANEFISKPISTNQEKKSHQTISPPLDQFCKSLINNVKKTGISIPKTFSKTLTVDVKHGACAQTWNELAKQLNLNITIKNAEPKSDFNNIEPNPTKYNFLPLPSNNDYFTCANDPDGDRHAVISRSKNIISPEEITAIILDYLLEQNQTISSVTSTVASSHLIKYICSKHNITYNETEVGFKYFAPYLTKANQENKISLAVESSGGFSSSYHTLEKCGFYPIICLLSILENKKITIDEAKSAVLKKYKTRLFTETTFNFLPEQKIHLNSFFKSTKRKLESLLQKPIKTINQIDGLKLIFEKDNWVLLRLSGTEPVCRIYIETKNHETQMELLNEITNILTHLIKKPTYN
jgi:phosphoglucomutase